jgi:bifunctional DNase/RNase
MEVNKWAINKGEMTLKLFDNEYKVLLTNEDLPIYLEISKKMATTKEEDMDGQKEMSNLLLELCRAGLKKANPEINKEEIDSFVNNNSFFIVSNFLGSLGAK